MTIDELNDARRVASRARAEWLVGLESGFVTIADVLQYSTSENGAPVQKLKLGSMLTAAHGAARARAAVKHILAVLEVDVPASEVTVGWLMDSRTGGRRLMALSDALNPKDAPPVPGFPFRTAASAQEAVA